MTHLNCLITALILISALPGQAAEQRTTSPASRTLPAQSNLPAVQVGVGGMPTQPAAGPRLPGATDLPQAGGGLQARPLSGAIRLGPGAHRSMHFQANVTFDKLNEKFTEFSGNAKAYEAGAKTMPEIAQKCASKTYSVQDQQAAGCQGNDTVTICQEKLYKHCVATYSSSGFSLPTVGYGLGQPSGGATVGAFSTQQFQQQAQTAANAARSLGMLLNQYANEVEQKTKALVP